MKVMILTDEEACMSSKKIKRVVGFIIGIVSLFQFQLWGQSWKKAFQSLDEKSTAELGKDQKEVILKELAILVGREGDTLENLELLNVLGTQLERAITLYEKGDSKWAFNAGIPESSIRKGRLFLNIVGHESDGMPLTEIVSQEGGKVLYEISPQEVEAEVPVDVLSVLASKVGKISLAISIKDHAHTGAWGATNARWWQLAGHVYGDGGPGGRPIKIALVDRFDTTLLDQQKRNGLVPANSRLDWISGDSIEGNTHGNRMLQLMYEIAPRAEYVLIQCGESRGSVVRAIDEAISMRPDVINLSLGSLVDRYNGTSIASPGPLMRAQERAASAGILVVSAAGNAGDPGLHWSGNFISSLRDPSYLNWNSNTSTIFDPRIPLSDQAARSSVNPNQQILVNQIGCVSANPLVPLIIDVGLPSQDALNYFIEIRRYNFSRNGWEVLHISSPGSNQNNQRSIMESFNPAMPALPGSIIAVDDGGVPRSCGANMASLGIAIKRGAPSAFDSEPLQRGNYINLFYTPNGTSTNLSIYNTSATLDESNVSPTVVTVGAASCVTVPGEEETQRGCGVGQPMSYSSRGPAIRGGTRPDELTRSVLTAESRDEMMSTLNPDAIKPDFVAPSPPVEGFPGISLGTSGATAITSATAALLMDRYPSLRQDKRDLRAALNRLAAKSASGTYYERRSSTPYTVEYYETLGSYKYGRGYFNLEREQEVYLRGRPNYAWLNASLTTSPKRSPRSTGGFMDSNLNGSESFQSSSMIPSSSSAYRYGDGLGPAVALYFNKEEGGGLRLNSTLPFPDGQAQTATRALFPVLVPYIGFSEHPIGVSVAGHASMVRPSVANTFTQPFPSTTASPRNYQEFLRQAGYFIFDRVSITRNRDGQPDTSGPFHLVLRAARRDGSLLPITRTQAIAEHVALQQRSENRTTFEGESLEDITSPLFLGCPECFIGERTTDQFYTCRPGYTPMPRDNCPLPMRP